MRRRRATVTGGLFSLALVGGLIASAGSPAQAPPRSIERAAECSEKDVKLLEQNVKDWDAFREKHENFDETALRRSSSEKYCKWLTDVVLPLKARVLARLEARMTDECGFDALMTSQRDYAALDLINHKRRMSGPCFGVKDD